MNINKLIHHLDKKQRDTDELMIISRNKKPNLSSYIKYNNFLFNRLLYSDDIYLQMRKNNLSNSNKKYINIEFEINTLNDLITLIETYPKDRNVIYNINMNPLYKIYPFLIKLKNMIGMNELKNNIIEQILYFSQNLHSVDGDFMHTCIYGPPGTGKTEVAKIIGNIYTNLGVLKKKSFVKVTRSDLIAGYLGQTAIKTRKVINEAIGGVLFIDEAYSLGNKEGRDSYAKECIDTLCEALSDHKHELMVIIAGYEHDLESCFFSYNQGLDSRFTWRFRTETYTPEQMKQIFIKKINDINWKYDKNDINTEWFNKNNKLFYSFGRDMEILLSKVKIAHSKRVFCLNNQFKKIINIQDLNNGFKRFLNTERIKNREKQNESNLLYNMYV